MTQVQGTSGYTDAVERFAQATISIDFADLHRAFLDFVPAEPSRVLDVGAGIGRDAQVLSNRGHSVVAVEPVSAFRAFGQQHDQPSSIVWINDSLPLLKQVVDRFERFDFVLASAVWHHLDQAQQRQAMNTIAMLLAPGGVFALSLRNGPAGLGHHVFATDDEQTIEQARAAGLSTCLHLPNQPSLMPNKPQVRWTRLVLGRPPA